MNKIANSCQFFDADTLHVQAVPNGAVILSVGELHITITPNSAQSLILKLMAALLLVADAKNIRSDILAAADRIRAEEF